MLQCLYNCRKDYLIPFLLSFTSLFCFVSSEPWEIHWPHGLYCRQPEFISGTHIYIWTGNKWWGKMVTAVNFLENWFWSGATLVLWLISLEACTPLDVLVPVGLHVLLSKLNSSHIALLIGWQDGVVGIDKKNKSVKKDMHETTLSIKKKRKIQ